MTHSTLTARRAGRSDHSVLVIAFMMALVFVPVLAMHAMATALGADAGLEQVTGRAPLAAKLSERVPG